MTHLELLLKYRNNEAKFIANEINKHPAKFKRQVESLETERNLICFDVGQEGSPWAVRVIFNLVDDRSHQEYLYFGLRLEAETIKNSVEAVNAKLKEGIEITLKDAILAVYSQVKYHI
mgnify:CR=1 FL=1